MGCFKASLCDFLALFKIERRFPLRRRIFLWTISSAKGNSTFDLGEGAKKSQGDALKQAVSTLLILVVYS